jgi:H+/Cl- antiporter ClcA
MPALIALGMAGFLAAATQAPLTAFIIVMEMVDGHSMVLSLMAAAMLASLVSRMISRPLYDTLAEHMVARATSSTTPMACEPPRAPAGPPSA